MSVQVKGSGTIGGLDEGLVVSGIVTSSTQINVGSNIKIGTAGVVTATSFVGSGANLTGIDATKIITGNTQVQTIDTGSDGHVKVITEGSERLRIGSNGEILTGGATSEPLYPAYSTARKVQAEIKGAIDVGQTRHHGSLAINCTNENATLHLIRSQANNTSGLDAGVIAFTVYDGTDFHQCARIMASRDATGGNNDTPGRLTFHTTADGASSATERLRIASDGKITVAANSDIRFTNGTWTGEVAGKIQQNSNNLYIQGGTGGIRFRHASSGSNQFSMTNGGNFEIVNGDLVVASGYGIDFSSTGNGGSSVAERFSDYEEGLWTPQVLDGNGSNYVVTKDTNNCYYTRIGRMVFVYYVMTNSENGSKTGNLYLPVSCLPFTPSHSALGAGSFWVDHSSPSAGLGDIIGGLHNVGSSGVWFVKPTDKSGIGQASTRYLQHGQWSYGRPIYGSFSYKV